jgi:hypothetical protein
MDHKPVIAACDRLRALDISLHSNIAFAMDGIFSCQRKTVMRRIKGFSLVIVAFAIAAISMFVNAPADARTARHHKATHFTADRAPDAGHGPYRGARSYGAGPASAYGAIPDGPGLASPSYPGFGYGYGDNQGCSACN